MKIFDMGACLDSRIHTEKENRKAFHFSSIVPVHCCSALSNNSLKKNNIIDILQWERKTTNLHSLHTQTQEQTKTYRVNETESQRKMENALSFMKPFAWMQSYCWKSMCISTVCSLLIYISIWIEKCADDSKESKSMRETERICHKRFDKKVHHITWWDVC